MLPKKYLDKLRENLHRYALLRRDVIKTSDDALHHAKRAVFALQRQNIAEAEEKLTEAENLLKKAEKMASGSSSTHDEGAYLAALEEFVEASLFYEFVTTGKIGEVKALAISGESYLAGLCDLPGELYRYAIAAATRHDMNMVKQCNDLASDIIGELIEFNLTSYLRNKFDQAKSAAQKLEQVVYEVSLRGTNN
jgi:translin